MNVLIILILLLSFCNLASLDFGALSIVNRQSQVSKLANSRVINGHVMSRQAYAATRDWLLTKGNDKRTRLGRDRKLSIV